MKPKGEEWNGPLPNAFAADPLAGAPRRQNRWGSPGAPTMGEMNGRQFWVSTGYNLIDRFNNKKMIHDFLLKWLLIGGCFFDSSLENMGLNATNNKSLLGTHCEGNYGKSYQSYDLRFKIMGDGYKSKFWKTIVSQKQFTMTEKQCLQCVNAVVLRWNFIN